MICFIYNIILVTVAIKPKENAIDYLKKLTCEPQTYSSLIYKPVSHYWLDLMIILFYITPSLLILKLILSFAIFNI